MRRLLLTGIGIVLVGCSQAGDLPVATGAPTTKPTLAVGTTTVPTAAVVTTITAPVLTASSLHLGESLVGMAASAVEVFELPDHAAPMRVMEPSTILGSPRAVLVEDGPVDGWIRVSLPIRPNGSSGWIRAVDLTLRVVDHTIFVDLSDKWLRLVRGAETVIETEVAVGSSANPTPTGRFFVTDVIQLTDPKGPWGPFALGLSAFSDTITEFNGGDGIIGIHGTNRPGSIGQAVSLGCVRVPNEIALQLAGVVALGTPVEISD
ncbi:MAG: L,D-transpeptidase [Acidimicrobiia bacterium]